jgi:hypothetical protein
VVMNFGDARVELNRERVRAGKWEFDFGYE